MFGGGLGFRLLPSRHGLNAGRARAYNRLCCETLADVEPHHAS
jgi:hypothetical protein